MVVQRNKTAAAAGDLQLLTRTALLGLEDKDLASQAQLGMQRLIKDLQATWEIENVLRDILANLDQCSAHARRLRYKLAAVLVQHHGYPAGLMSLIMRRFTEQAAFEKQPSAVEELAGFMQEVARAVLLLHVHEDDMFDQQDGLSTLLIRPLLRSAAKTPAKHMASNAYVLVSAALMVFFEQAQSPSVAAVASDCLKHILGSMSTGQTRVLVAEAFLPMRKSVEILGCDTQPAVVRSLINESLQCMKLKTDWHLRKEAADTIAALAASSQVFRRTEDAWQLEQSDSLAVLAAEKSTILAALTDVKYDKIVHVRQAAQKALIEMESIPEPSSPLKPAHMHTSMPAPWQPSSKDGPLPSKAYSPDPPSATCSVSRATENGGASENRHTRDGDLHGASSQRPAPAASWRRWAPLQRIDSNADAPLGRTADMVRGREDLPTRRAGGAEKADAQQRRVQSVTAMPKARPRRRAAGSLDFGVQVYAPERPQAQSSVQEGGGKEHEGAGSIAAWQMQPQACNTKVNAKQSSGDHERSATPETSQHETSANAEDHSAVDTKLLLEQLRSFQELVSAASGQPPPQDQAARTVGQATPYTPSALHLNALPDTPTYVMGAAPEETPQPAVHARTDATKVSTPAGTGQVAHQCTPPSAHNGLAAAGSWEATPEARAILQGQRQLMAQLQRLLDNPGALQAHGAGLRELQGSLLQATATLQHSRALHNIQGVLGDACRFETPPAAQRHPCSDAEQPHGGLAAPGSLEETPREAAPVDGDGAQQQSEQPLEEFQQVMSSSQRMQSLLSDRLSSSKKFKEARSDWPDPKPAPDACSAAMHADGNSSNSYLSGAVPPSSSDGGSSAKGRQMLGSLYSLRAGMPEPGPVLQDRRSSWHQGAEPRLSQTRERRSASAADEAAVAARRVQSAQGHDEEPLAGITREVNRLLQSPGKPASRRWSLQHPAEGQLKSRTSEQGTPVSVRGEARPASAGSASAGRSKVKLATPLSTGGRGSPGMDVHCNPLFGAEGLPLAGAAQKDDGEPSKNPIVAQSAGSAPAKLGVDNAVSRSLEHNSGISYNGDAGAKRVPLTSSATIQARPKESDRKVAQLEALRLQVNRELDALVKLVEG